MRLDGILGPPTAAKTLGGPLLDPPMGIGRHPAEAGRRRLQTMQNREGDRRRTPQPRVLSPCPRAEPISGERPQPPASRCQSNSNSSLPLLDSAAWPEAPPRSVVMALGEQKGATMLLPGCSRP